MINRDFGEGWDGLLLHLANDESLDLGEFPVVSKTEDGCPIFGRRIVDRVYTVDERRLARRLAFGSDT